MALPFEQPLLETRQVVKRYGGLIATNKVDLKIEAGEVCGVIGPNGAGKSTLIGLLGGALTPSEGRIYYSGRDITSLPAPERARMGIGRTYQIPRPFLDMTVEENLEVAQFSLEPFRSSGEARIEREDILRRCGLMDAAHLPARALPLLRRKRLEVARALALKPNVLLLDEVGAGLVDSEVTELIALIKSVQAPDRAIVIIEHVIRVVKECCERLVVINFGKKIAEGATADVLASDEVASVYLGTAHSPDHAAAKAAPVAALAPETSGGETAQSRELARDFAPLIGKPGEDKGQPLLSLQDVCAGYGQARVLQGVGLSVAPGETTAILGPNGAGKTTLACAISGAVKLSSGSLHFAGQDISRMPAHERAAIGIAHCMEGRRIFAPLSVEENLAIAARGLDQPARKERLDLVYELFPDLAQRRHSPGTAMSGGQQQMLAIGRALMARPRLVIFDEISLGLAPVMMDRLYEALAQLRGAGLTMLIIEQDVDRALALADHVHVLERGAFGLSGTPEEIRADPLLRHLYIGEAD